MAKLRVSTFNCENLFSRAKILSFDNAQAAGPLDQLAQLNSLLAEAAYSAADKTTIVDLIHALRDFLDINELREKLLIHHQNGTDEVRPEVLGRADWIGGIRLLRSVVPTDAQKNTAKVIEGVAADIQAVVEVESRELLEQFNSVWLSAGHKFAQNLVIRGNDDRGINVGIFSKHPIVDVKTHIFDADGGGHRIFSRDCLEVTIDVPHGANVTLLVNHLKSKGYGTQAENDAKRKAQADRVATIVGDRAKKERLIVLGDFNDTPDSAPLNGLLTVDGLTDILAAKVPDAADRWTYHYKNQKSQIDYILVSSKLNAIEAGIERRGIFGVTGVQHFPTVNADTNAASDHAAVWADFDI